LLANLNIVYWVWLEAAARFRKWGGQGFYPVEGALHVGNHGTDHRAQLLRLLNDLGVKTASQDYISYVYDNS
jgi:uncharacterized damage-inducible protein DinB